MNKNNKQTLKGFLDIIVMIFISGSAGIGYNVFKPGYLGYFFSAITLGFILILYLKSYLITKSKEVQNK